MKRWPMAVVVLVGMLGLLAGPVQAAEITVLGGMGVVSGLHDLAPAFEKMTGHKVIVRFVQTADINQKINSGAPADIAALQPQQVDAFIKDGKMVAGTKTNFVQAGVGVAVKTGARRPDISTVEAFKTAMLKAKSIGYSRGGSGLISAQVMEKLGIADQLKAKTKFIDGIPVAEVVAKGEVEIGLQQINVILPVKGADYIGPLPKELQETVKFSAGVLTTSKQPEVAKAFSAGFSCLASGGSVCAGAAGSQKSTKPMRTTSDS
ncbi:MAG: ABC transporter substrate-binding protein [Acidobacteria bacterium]|nr:MAG: ABC transporter substrate-binding protein [Acidobacteriota bacterium]